jgi:hypothetical protein
MSVLVNKLDTTREEEMGSASEFDIETLDDVKSQTGGASTNNTSPSTSNSTADPTLSVPLTSNSKESGNNIPNTVTSNNTNNLNKLPSSNQTDDVDKMAGANSNNNTTKLITENKNNNTITAPADNTSTTNNQVNTAPKTKKAGKGKKTGLTKKKRAPLDPGNTNSAINNDVQPQVELGSDRGTMTIKYASSKTMVPLFSTDKSNHLDLATLRDAFQSSYKTVTGMSSDELTKLRHDMLNTEFNEMGADSIITGLLYLLDDCDTKKLTLRMMLAKGELKIGA